MIIDFIKTIFSYYFDFLYRRDPARSDPAAGSGEHLRNRIIIYRINDRNCSAGGCEGCGDIFDRDHAGHVRSGSSRTDRILGFVE